eukprot:247111_1
MTRNHSCHFARNSSETTLIQRTIPHPKIIRSHVTDEPRNFSHYPLKRPLTHDKKRPKKKFYRAKKPQNQRQHKLDTDIDQYAQNYIQYIPDASTIKKYRHLTKIERNEIRIMYHNIHGRYNDKINHPSYINMIKSNHIDITCMSETKIKIISHCDQPNTMKYFKFIPEPATDGFTNINHEKKGTSN